MAKGYRRPQAQRGGGMMGQIAKMQEQMATVQESLAEEMVTESVGGGAVSITMSGDQVCKSITIDPELLKDGDVEMLQDLIIAAVNDGLEQVDQKAAERMSSITGGLSIPGLT